MTFTRDPLLWRCPDCAAATWPGVDADGRIRARRCVPCQVVADDAAVEVARVHAQCAVQPSDLEPA